MIKLFVSDIDGCIAEPYQPYDLKQINSLAEMIHGEQEGVPAFSLCSGRAYSYVEAVSQMLGLQVPVIFESGGGLFDPTTATVTWNPSLTREVEDELDEIRTWLKHECLPGTRMMGDFGKRTQAGIIGADAAEVSGAVPRIHDFIRENFGKYRVFHTSVSVDVAHPEITKRQALQWLASTSGLSLEETAFIGDTNGDIPALEIVGKAYAPANATDDVKEVVATVTEAAVAGGVIEAFRACILFNASEVSSPQPGR